MIVVSTSSSILVVDGTSETTAVLKAVFEPQGHTVQRVHRSQLSADSPSRPSVVVWHAHDSQDATAAPFGDVPHVVIGRVKVANSCRAVRQFSQPFEYGELLRAVESLLCASPGGG